MTILGALLFISSLSSAAQSRGILKRDCTFSVWASTGDTCSSLAAHWGITEEQFESYNPGVDCSSALTAGSNYCIEWNDGQPPPASSTTTTTTSSTISTTAAGPSPTQSGIASNCDAFYKAVSGDTCQQIVDKFGNFTLNNFYTWNPAVGSDCSLLLLGDYYCIGTISGGGGSPTTTTSGPPQPEQTGIISSCTSYYKVVSGDTCSKIVDDYGTFTLSDFLAWNPAVGSDCSTLFLGYYVCVGISGTPTTRSTTASPTATSTPTGPTPTQSGIAANCGAYYLVQTGDYCQEIVDKFNGKFTLSQFYSWNPAVGSSCGNLWVGYYVCVGLQ
ncbi:LysM domain-containing protein [Ustulina deusta]|nr:LysM domain-containing protein [Ustulina deusta]